MIASTPTPPYYAVIFTNILSRDTTDYAKTAERMLQLASEQPGFLGVEAARATVGITVSYWRDLDAIRQWKENVEHLEAQRRGRETWYEHFTTRIALVEREYSL